MGGPALSRKVATPEQSAPFCSTNGGLREIIMPGIVETLPVKTRLPLEVWALAGFVTLFSLVTSVAHLSSLSDGASPVIEHATQQETARNRTPV